MTDQSTPAPPQSQGPPAYMPPPPAPPGQQPAPSARGSSRWTAGRVISVVIGSIAALVAIALLVAGFGVLVADQSMRDSDGYLSTPSMTMSTSGYAVSTGNVLLETSGNDQVFRDVIGTVRVRVTQQVADAPVFVGMAPTGLANAYLSGVAHTRADGPGPRGEFFTGGEPPVPPEEAGIWSESASGTGEVEFEWTPQSGNWTLVVMNADASRGVDATMRVAATLPWMTGLAIGLIIAGVLALAVAIVMIVIPISLVSRDRRERERAGSHPPSGPSGTPADPYGSSSPYRGPGQAAPYSAAPGSYPPGSYPTGSYPTGSSGPGGPQQPGGPSTQGHETPGQPTG